MAATSIELSQTSVPVLAIGAPGDDVDGIVDSGSVTVQFWSGGAPGAPTVWTQDSTDIEDAAESGDEFGSALTLALTGGTYQAMLSIGVPLEDVDTLGDAGAANVLYGDSGAFYPSNNQVWTQDSEGVNDVAEPNDSFGQALPEG